MRIRTQHSKLNKSLLTGLSAIACLIGQQAAAQGVMEEIVVSAQKRDESLQDVPLHIQAFQADAFDKAQITRIEELVNISPTLTLQLHKLSKETRFILQ